MDDELLASLAALEAPMLVVTGADERRISLRYTEAWVDVLRAHGARVRFVIFPEEGHFLLFSQPDAVMETLGGWVDGGP